MRFGSPEILWLLAVAPAIIWFYYTAWRKNRELIARFVHPNHLERLTEFVWFKIKQWKMVLVVCAFVFLIIAAAQPQWGFKWEEVKQKGLDIIVAIDTSRSMLAEDIKPNRLTRAKLAAVDLMSIAKSDRLGLVTFAGSAFLQCPLTLDEEAFRQSVNVLDVDIMPQGGTAIAEAINIASEAFKEGTENHRIIVLFTDGEDHEEGAVEAAENAAKKGIKIFTVGIGTPEGETLKIRNPDGRIETITDETGKPVVSRLNQALLQEIAAKTGGFYLQLTGAKTIETLYERGIAPLPKGEQASRLVKKYNERFYIPLLIAIALLVLEIFLPERKPIGRFQIIGKLGLVLILALLSNTHNAEASISSAIKNFYDGKYKTALQEFEELLKKRPNDPKLLFNAGVTAYQLERYSNAVNYFTKALDTPQNQSLQKRTYYNLGNSLYRLGENKDDLSERYELWKNALSSYESALKFDPKDENAKFNRDFVKKKLEELEKMLPKQQQQQQGQDNQQQKDKQKNQGENKDKQQQQQQQKGDKENQQSAEQQKQLAQQQQQQQQMQQQQAKQGDNKGQTNGQVQAEARAVYMTPEQLKQLLEAQKSEEKMLIFQPPNTEKSPKQSERYIKNW
jgi:Ca-activated chloride channel family protein